MKETLPSTPVGAIDEDQVPENEYDQDGLENLDYAASGAVKVLDLARRHGEPREDVVETDRGLKGWVGASVPGGRLEALFDGTGEGAKPEEIKIYLDGEDGTEHAVGVRIDESGGASIFVDGEPVRPEDVPAVAGMIDQLLAEQTQDNKLDPSDSGDPEQKRTEIDEELSELKEMGASLEGIAKRIDQAKEKLLGVQVELGAMGEMIDKLFKELAELFIMLQTELNAIAKEDNLDKKETMQKDLQKKINDFAIRMGNIGV